MSNPAPLPVEQGPLVCSESDKESAVDDFSPNEPVQFLLPRRALAAINPMAIIAEARRDGVNSVRIGVDDRGARASETRLTCGFTMAVRVVRAIERAGALAAEKCDGPLAADLAIANQSAIAALGSRVRRPLHQRVERDVTDLRGLSYPGEAADRAASSAAQTRAQPSSLSLATERGERPSSALLGLTSQSEAVTPSR
jgi:hypothetical protein